MRFVVDRHLGSLARWLRTLGYDTFFAVDCSDDRLRAEAQQQDVVFITTSEKIIDTAKPHRPFLVSKENLREQLHTVISSLNLDLHSFLFSRCVICNVPVQMVKKEECKGKIPEHVYDNFEQFTHCPSCGRVFWMGTHTERLIKRLNELMK